MILDGSTRIHFVGIGGAGMSAIAKVLLERGKEISGSDLKTSTVTGMLQAMGARVHIGHSAENVADAEVVIVSSAIPDSNPEKQKAMELGLPILSRGAALAALLENVRSVVVAGTHGKTTTTSMIASVFLTSGADPTYLIGGGLNDSGTNARSGGDDLAIAESDESDGSFLALRPHIAVVTNVEADHLDHWHSLDAIRSAFATFVTGAQEAVVFDVRDDELRAVVQDAGKAMFTFGPGGDVAAEDVEMAPTGTSFLLRRGAGAARVKLPIPGEHNILNALAAAAACLASGLEVDVVASGLEAYQGVERRYEVRGESAGVVVIDDYAHHPTEVRATLAAAATQRNGIKRIVALFQPHRYSRTAALHREFGSSFESADSVVITDVYGAGEEPLPGVTGKLVADSVATRLFGKPVAYLPHRAELLVYLQKHLRSGDALVTMGAGDVTTVGDEILARLGSSS